MGAGGPRGRPTRAGRGQKDWVPPWEDAGLAQTCSHRLGRPEIVTKTEGDRAGRASPRGRNTGSQGQVRKPRKVQSRVEGNVAGPGSRGTKQAGGHGQQAED